jgi:hypothetical protein
MILKHCHRKGSSSVGFERSGCQRFQECFISRKLSNDALKRSSAKYVGEDEFVEDSVRFVLGASFGDAQPSVLAEDPVFNVLYCRQYVRTLSYPHLWQGLEMSQLPVLHR